MTSLDTAQLVGRTPELTLVERSLGRVAAGSASVLAVTGEPGIGKSALLDAASRRAGDRDLPVFQARAAEFEREPPFGVFVDALDDYLGSLNPRTFARLGPADLAELAGVFPALADLTEEAPRALADERYRSHRAIAALLELLAGRRPLVLVLDDLQWAGDASAELVSHLLRRRPKGPLLLALAYRRHEAAAKFAGGLSDGELVELEPLRPAEADRLIGEDAASDARPELYRESGGNPFYLQELLRAGGRRAHAAATGVRRDDVPEAVTAALAAELGALGDEARRMLEGAAVVGDPFDPEIAGVAADTDEATSLALLDDLIDADLVRSTELPRQFRFRHPIVRAAVYEAIKPGWRLAAHARVAAILRERGADASTCAHHVERSASIGDQEAIALLTEAGHAAAAPAPAAAAHWFEAALRLLAYEGDPARRLALLVPRATALGAAGRIAEGRDALREALALTPPEATADRAGLAAACAGMEYLLHRVEEALSLLRRTLAELPDQRSREAAALKLAIAYVRFLMLDTDEIPRLADEVLAQARADGDAALEANARTARAVWAARRGAEGRPELDRAAALADRLPDDELAPWVSGFVWLAWGECFVESFDAVRRHVKRALSVARATGQGNVIGHILLCEAYAAIWQGQVDTARRHLDDVIASSELTGNDEALIWSLMHRCWVAWLAGDGQAARTFGERAVGLAGDDPPTRAVAGFMLAEAELEAGDAAGCRDRILAVGGGPDLPHNEALWRPRWYGVLARAELALGEADRAEGWVTRAEQGATRLGLAGRMGWALHARAELRLARGDVAGAAEAARAAAEKLGEAGNRIDGARSHALHGSALAAGGERAAAVAALEHARSEFEQSGALHLRDGAARELRRLGRRVPRTGAAGPGEDGVGSLSARELEIAKLVHQGRTNKQIAAALYLSERTIETHLTHAFRKLAVKGRAELAAAVERERAAQPV